MGSKCLGAIWFIFCLCMVACSESAPKQPILRIDQALASYANLDVHSRALMADSLAPEIQAFFATIGHPDPSPQVLQWWSEGDEVAVFQPDINQAYPDLSDLESQLGHILMKAERDSLALPPLRFAAVAWGKPQPIIRNDSVVLIALNHYLGADYPGYSHWEPYRRADKDPKMLPYDLAAVIVATQYPFDMGEQPAALLNWMLYEGALIEARMALVPNAMLNLALGYDPAQLEVADINTRKIWEEMIRNKWVYDTNPAIINRLLTAAPNTPLLQGRAPGRIGRYIGYLIVREYMKRHPEATLPYLLSPAFYASTQSLIDSGF